MGGTPAAFTGDEFHFVTNLSNDEWLDDAELGNGLLEFVEGFLRKPFTGLERRSDDLVKGNLNNRLSWKEFDLCFWNRIGAGSLDKCSQSFS